MRYTVSMTNKKQNTSHATYNNEGHLTALKDAGGTWHYLTPCNESTDPNNRCLC